MNKVRDDARLRFWSRVRKTDGCWLWTGGTDRDGYGVVAVTGRRSSVRAHRLSYELNVRPLSAGEVVRHRCDNPPCVRPDHLVAGTVADNNEDARSRGRARGRPRAATETSAALAEGLIAKGATISDAARKLGVTRWSLVRAMRRRRVTK